MFHHRPEPSLYLLHSEIQVSKPLSPSPRRLTTRIAMAIATITALSPHVESVPTLGATLTAFSVTDVTGRRHSSTELVGQPTLVLVMTDCDADAPMRAWSTTADRRLPPTVRRVQFVALDLAFIVPTDLARSMARGRSPERTWRDTWFDRDGSFRVTLGLPESETPWAIALDPHGRITAIVHTQATSPAAERVWAALAQ